MGYFVRHIKQLNHRMCRKITYIIMCKFMIQKGKNLSLFQSSYIQLQTIVSSLTPRKYTVQAVPSKKKKPSGDGKKEKKKNGWKEFVRKERKKGE